MDANKSRKLSLMLVLFFQVLAATLPGCFLAASQQPPIPAVQTIAPDGNGFGSSLVFPVTENVHPLGYFAVSLSIGNPPMPFTLDIDTGSDLTWVQSDASCTGCTVPPDQLYRPVQGSTVLCMERNEPCQFNRLYADGSSVHGMLVRDNFHLGNINGTPFQPSLTFGCAYDIRHGPHSSPPTGLLGLGKGAASISSQLRVENVIGHCYSAKGGGFMFIGNDTVTSSGVSWVPMLRNTWAEHYASGPADLLYGGDPIRINGLNVIFDSGTTFTYFNSAVYIAILNRLTRDLPIERVQDQTFSVCWKGAWSYFKPFTLSFTSTTNAQLQLTPENYLRISKEENVCLGILDGTEAGMGNINVIGDISMLDKLVIYDNEREQIGWTSANCNNCCSLNILFHLQIISLLCLIHNIK